MADAKYMSITVTTTAQSFSNSDTNQQFTLQAPSTNTVPIAFCPDGDTAVKDIGFQIYPGETYLSPDLPPFLRNGSFSVVVSANTEVLLVAFSHAQTPAS